MKFESPPYSRGLAAAYVSGGELLFSQRMSHWILRMLYHREAGRVLDIACGAGEAVRVFRNAGWHAVGLDRSEAMLRLARARNRGTKFRLATMQHIINVGGRFDLITCMYDAINCNLRVSDLFLTFRNVQRILKPRGKFVFDAFTVKGLHRAYNGLELHTLNQDHIVLTSARVDRRHHIGTKELMGASRETDWMPWREVHSVCAYPPRVLLNKLKQAGFTSVKMYGWPIGRIVSVKGTNVFDRIVVVAQREEPKCNM